MKATRRAMVQTQAMAGNPASPCSLPHAANYGVLVADDDAEIRDVLNDGLRREGFSVWLAADGQDAVNTYCWNAGTIHVALLDVRMPVLDGPETFAVLKRFNPAVTCCFMSGHLGSYSSAGLRQMGAATIFWKPFRLMEVAEVLKKLAHQSTQQRTECMLDARGCLQSLAQEVSAKKMTHRSET